MKRVALFILITVIPVTMARAQTPDTILINGTIIALDEASSIHEAVAIHDDQILAIGPTAQVQQLAGTDTRVIDLDGRTVIPGLIDSHIHAIRAARSFSTEVNLIGTRSIVEAMDRISAKAAQVGPDAWLIVAGGWSEAQFAENRRPTQAELVAAAPDNPVYVQLGYSWALMSPRALDLLGIEGPADIPPPGQFEDGGVSGPSSVIVGLFDQLPAPTYDEQIEGTKLFFREMNRLAITGVGDPGGNNLAAGPDYYPLFDVWRNGDLTVRVVYSLGSQTDGNELEEFKNFTQMTPMGFGDNMLRFSGIGERVTAAMNNNDNPTDAEKERFYDVARWAAERGMAVTVHWPNDASVNQLLDLFEQVSEDIPIRDLRWSVAHLNDASAETLERMRDMGVGWTVQLGMYYGGEGFRQRAGAAAAGRAPAVVTAMRLGTPTGMGTDAHRVATYNPFTALQWLLDGTTIGGTEIRSGAEIPSRQAALRLYSIGSAWFSHDDDQRGSIEVGKLADIAVLSDDYLTMPVGEIGILESVLTIVDGNIVYASGPYTDLEQPD
jgi:predicted amidohydrolase YtcJ